MRLLPIVQSLLRQARVPKRWKGLWSLCSWIVHRSSADRDRSIGHAAHWALLLITYQAAAHILEQEWRPRYGPWLCAWINFGVSELCQAFPTSEGHPPPCMWIDHDTTEDNIFLQWTKLGSDPSRWPQVPSGTRCSGLVRRIATLVGSVVCERRNYVRLRRSRSGATFWLSSSSSR